jgi:hypothetical protein
VSVDLKGALNTLAVHGVAGGIPGALVGGAVADDDQRAEGAAAGLLAGTAGLYGARGLLRTDMGRRLHPVVDVGIHQSAAPAAGIGAGALVNYLSPDESASKIASSPLKLAVLRAMTKQADLRTSLMRALGGAAVGGAVGGGGGALMAHLQGGDVAANARKGAIGGAGLGMMGGALSGFTPRGSLAGMPADALTKGTGAALTGIGAAFGAHLTSPISGGGGAAAEQAQRELGKFNGQQAIKQQQSVSLAPQQDAAFRQAQQDEVIQQADPALVASSFATMKRFAPNLAADPNAVRSFLRESATWNSGPSYATLKNLADAERAVAGAGGAGSSF